MSKKMALFILSVDIIARSLSLDAKELAKVIRKHWTIENQLHWGGVSGGGRF